MPPLMPTLFYLQNKAAQSLIFPTNITIFAIKIGATMAMSCSLRRPTPMEI